jgi:hypothetical protein
MHDRDNQSNNDRRQGHPGVDDAQDEGPPSEISQREPGAKRQTNQQADDRRCRRDL